MKRILLALVCLLAAGTAGAQTITLDDAEVRLGTDKSNTLAAVSTELKVVPGLDGYTLFRPGDGEQLGEPVGTLRFSDGRLTQVQRALGSFHGQSAARALQRLITAFQSAPDGENPDAIQTESTDAAKGVHSRVVFNLPDRQIVVSLFQPKDAGAPATAELSEHFRLEKR